MPVSQNLDSVALAVIGALPDVPLRVLRGGTQASRRRILDNAVLQLGVMNPKFQPVFAHEACRGALENRCIGRLNSELLSPGIRRNVVIENNALALMTDWPENQVQSTAAPLPGFLVVFSEDGAGINVNLVARVGYGKPERDFYLTRIREAARSVPGVASISIGPVRSPADDQYFPEQVAAYGRVFGPPAGGIHVPGRGEYGDMFRLKFRRRFGAARGLPIAMNHKTRTGRKTTMRRRPLISSVI